jgi:hypothetical protein
MPPKLTQGKPQKTERPDWTVRQHLYDAREKAILICEVCGTNIRWNSIMKRNSDDKWMHTDISKAINNAGVHIVEVDDSEFATT